MPLQVRNKDFAAVFGALAGISFVSTLDKLVNLAMIKFAHMQVSSLPGGEVYDAFLEGIQNPDYMLPYKLFLTAAVTGVSAGLTIHYGTRRDEAPVTRERKE